MQFKILFKWSLIIAAIAGTAFFAEIIFFPNANLLAGVFYSKPSLSGIDQNPQSLINNGLAESMRVIISPDQIRTELPVSLRIPAINVDAKIEQAGVKDDGEMDMPKGPAAAAWFNLGPRPGERGSAVIYGHYGWKDGIQAVFDNLHKLKKGDKIYTEGEKGGVITFVVREIRSYVESADAPDVFGSSDGKAHLNLITCEGTWNKSRKSYSNRLVVFTDKE